MKTQILHLEPHDDTLSAREKMGWSQAERILLVWPGRGSLLERRLDLVLLKRQSKKMGAQLAFVTRNPNVRFHARQLSIPVYRTPTEAKKATWPTPRPDDLVLDKGSILESRPLPDLEGLRAAAHPPQAAWQRSTAVRLAIFTLGVLALLSVAAALAPAAVIELDPKTTGQEVILDVQAHPDVQEMNLSGLIPANPVHIVVEGRESLRSTGSLLFPYETASGQVLLTNLIDRALEVPAGSILRTLGNPPVRFATTRTGRVAAGPGATVTLPVRALESGKSGNLSAGQLAAFEGPLGLDLTVTNPEPTRGGNERRGPAPSQEDYELLNRTLRASLRSSALQEISGQVKPGDVLLPSTLTLAEVIEETFDPAEVQPSDWLDLSLRLDFQVLVASGEDLRSLAAGALDANLPAGFRPVPGSLQIIPLSAPGVGEDGFVRWRIKGERNIRAELPENQAAHLAQGQSIAEADQRLSSNLPLASPPRILLAPSWWPRLPYVPFRIEVKTRE